jgi:squalene-associated FAD-dependent desaturase
MAEGTVHIVGAGLAGLAAAIGLVGTGRKIVVHELARHAGGRCRSYFEPSLGLTVDNGNHLLLSANHAALAFLRTIGAEEKLVGPEEAEFAFADLASGERWLLRPNKGRVPWWIFSAARRVPGTRPADYLALTGLLPLRRDRKLVELIDCKGTLYERLSRPVFLAALNTDPAEASALLASAILRETLARGGSACRPLVAEGGLGAAFIDPALAYLEREGVKLCFDHQLRRFQLAGDKVAALDFGEDIVRLAESDRVILAVPAKVASLFLPELSAPNEFRAIVNAHFKLDPPKTLPKVLGIINGTAEWLFAFPGRVSATISAADRWIEPPRELLAKKIWADIARLTGLGEELPPWQIVKERRATFAALPRENAKRPGSQTRWRNLFLAGDWTATGLPATIEGAIRSGNSAARLVRTAAQDRSLNGSGRGMHS